MTPLDLRRRAQRITGFAIRLAARAVRIAMIVAIAAVLPRVAGAQDVPKTPPARPPAGPGAQDAAAPPGDQREFVARLAALGDELDAAVREQDTTNNSVRAEGARAQIVAHVAKGAVAEGATVSGWVGMVTEVSSGAVVLDFSRPAGTGKRGSLAARLLTAGPDTGRRFVPLDQLEALNVGHLVKVDAVSAGTTLEKFVGKGLAAAWTSADVEIAGRLKSIAVVGGLTPEKARRLVARVDDLLLACTGALQDLEKILLAAKQLSRGDESPILDRCATKLLDVVEEILRGYPLAGDGGRRLNLAIGGVGTLGRVQALLDHDAVLGDIRPGGFGAASFHLGEVTMATLCRDEYSDAVLTARQTALRAARQRFSDASSMPAGKSAVRDALRITIDAPEDRGGVDGGTFRVVGRVARAMSLATVRLGIVEPRSEKTVTPGPDGEFQVELTVAAQGRYTLWARAEWEGLTGDRVERDFHWNAPFLPLNEDFVGAWQVSSNLVERVLWASMPKGAFPRDVKILAESIKIRLVLEEGGAARLEFRPKETDRRVTEQLAELDLDAAGRWERTGRMTQDASGDVPTIAITGLKLYPQPPAPARKGEAPAPVRPAIAYRSWWQGGTETLCVWTQKQNGDRDESQGTWLQVKR